MLFRSFDVVALTRKLELYDNPHIAAVATFGKKISDVQIFKLQSKGIRTVIIGYDGDAVEAVKRTAERLKPYFEVFIADIADDTVYQVVNPDQIICTLDQDTMFECEFQVRVGRGFATGDENKVPDMPIGVIPIDSIFSPVTRVKYSVQNTRVGQMTDYDKLILEVWTDGRIAPADAMLQASAILRHHLDVFVNYDDKQVNFEEAPSAVQDEETARLRKLLNMSVNEIELSVRAANCLNNANITTVGQLAMKSESEMLKYRNFGKKSLNEIKDKLLELGLSLGVQVDPSLLTGPVPQAKPRLGLEEESPVGLADLIAANIEDDDD